VLREEAESLKKEKADEEARIRREEQVRYQEELKRQSIDAQRMLTELQQQQLELQETLKYCIMKFKLHIPFFFH